MGLRCKIWVYRFERFEDLDFAVRGLFTMRYGLLWINRQIDISVRENILNIEDHGIL